MSRRMTTTNKPSRIRAPKDRAHGRVRLFVHDPGDHRQDQGKQEQVGRAAGRNRQRPGPRPPRDRVQGLLTGAKHLSDATVGTSDANERSRP